MIFYLFCCFFCFAIAFSDFFPKCHLLTFKQSCFAPNSKVFAVIEEQAVLLLANLLSGSFNNFVRTE